MTSFSHIYHSWQDSQEPFFQHDNAQPHTERILQDYLHHIANFPWPSRSPDLSPIKHILNHLGRQVVQSTSLIEPEVHIQQMWNETFQHIIRNLYASMPARIASYIRARGGSTLY
ncbi:transposable element Tcb1 transposase [Trichonephila clavipes]|nr:transposable element Tcb1 transposase [Trichonephila clavipes]